MEMDIYKCTVYTEQMRLGSALEGKELSEIDKRMVYEQCRANALSLIKFSSYPPEPSKKRSYDFLNKLFVNEVCKSKFYPEIRDRKIKPNDLVPILVNARIKAVETYPMAVKLMENEEHEKERQEAISKIL